MELRHSEHCLKCAACDLWLYVALAYLRNRERAVTAEIANGEEIAPGPSACVYEARLSDWQDFSAVGG